MDFFKGIKVTTKPYRGRSTPQELVVSPCSGLYLLVLAPPLFQKNSKKKPYMWHLTGDTWHVTPDMWHVTRGMWHLTHGGGLTFSPNFISLALTVWDFWYLEDLEEKDWLLNYEAVCRTAPATPGLLITIIANCQYGPA